MTETHYPHDDTRIQSPELAHHIGYAEYPHIELARIALAADLEAEYQIHMLNAEVAGKEAAEQYAREIAADIGRFVGTLKSPAESVEPDGHEEASSPEKYPGVFVTKRDMIQFAEKTASDDQRGLAGNKRVGGVPKYEMKAGAVWGSIKNLVQDLEQPPSESPWSSRKDPLIEKTKIVIDETKRGINFINVSLDSLIALLDEFDRLSYDHPTAQVSDILGKGFGDIKLDFLRSFVADKCAQLDAQNGENSDQPS